MGATTVTCEGVGGVALSWVTLAVNNGSVKFNATSYTDGYGSVGDVNYVVPCDLFVSLAHEFVLRVQMGPFVDYFYPSTAPSSACGMSCVDDPLL